MDIFWNIIFYWEWAVEGARSWLLHTVAGMVKIMRSIAMYLLTIDPTYIPHRDAIWDLRNSVNLIKTGRARPLARRGCSAYASESDTINTTSLRGVGYYGPSGPEAKIQNCS